MKSLQHKVNRLRELFKSLPPQQQTSLLDFAEFLGSHHTELAPVVLEIRDIPRPEDETIIAALKRLRETYTGLDSAPLLNESSSLMAQHIMQGRDAKQVIDELEAVFQEHYKRAISEHQQPD